MPRLDRLAVLPLLVIVALPIIMGFAVSSFLTQAVSDWESESVAMDVRREFADAGSETLFENGHGPQANERWQKVLARVVRHVPGVVRCKVWDRDRTVVWSDDERLVGSVQRENPDL